MLATMTQSQFVSFLRGTAGKYIDYDGWYGY